jgi:hypothetical protein
LKCITAETGVVIEQELKETTLERALGVYISNDLKWATILIQLSIKQMQN